LPPALSSKYLPGGGTPVLNVCQFERINGHPSESVEDSTLESVSDTKNCLNWNSDLHNPNVSEDDREADEQTKVEVDNGIPDPESREYSDVSATPNVSRLIRATQRSIINAARWLMMFTAMETRRIKQARKSRAEWVNMVSPGSIYCLTENFTVRNILGEFSAVGCEY